MNHKLKDIIDNFELSLSEDERRNITSSLGIKDLRKNPTPEQEAELNHVCQLIKDGQSIDLAISKVTQQDSSESSSLSDADLEQIIIAQANKAADATLSTLPNLAQTESLNLRETFVQQFRTRIQQQLQSPEYQKAFIAQIECLGELPTLNSSTQNIALPSSSSSSS